MKFLLPLLRNNILQLSHANQLRYADTKNRTKTITLYMLIAAILMGLLAYLIYSLKIIYSIAWSLEEVVTELVIPMVLICVSLNIAISVFWGSGLLLSDTNIDSMLALPIPLRTLILSKLTVLFMVEVALTVALLLPMMVLFGLTADMGFPFYLIVHPAVDASTFEASGEIIETYGTFESYGNVSYVADKTDDGIEFVRVIQIANYEKGKLTFTASFFEDGSVAGFRLAD